MTQALSPAILGVQYAERITATGGSEPYEFRMTGGTLPPGVFFVGHGGFDGSPQTTGTWIMDVEVQDQAGQKASRRFQLRVAEATANGG
ncbi:MAG: putative Ig domain-containing protein [bacterium]|nr:putative Ig domain-containing protein [bacterium]